MDIRLPSPPAKFRPSPFWSWNADLDPDELRRQTLMHRLPPDNTSAFCMLDFGIKELKFVK